jgi:hypothetical protein
LSSSTTPIRAVLGAVAIFALAGCPSARSPGGADRSALAQKWFDRTKQSYASIDLDDAWDAARSAMQAAPNDVEVRTWAGRVALAKLDFGEVVRLLKGVNTTDAKGLRGRAKWYAGDVDQAADELESMLQDPEVHDGWAKAIATLARRGAGRKPFQLTGGLLAVSEMPRLPNNTSFLVPVEIDGEQGLAMVATGTAEVTIDSSARKEPAWVSLRFGGRIEVKDVPAMVQDLSGVSRQMNVPIKALLGVNLLRHLNVTFDYIGGQFIVRTFTPPIPPSATRVPIAYIKGGGMLMRSALSTDKGAPPASLLLDSAMSFPIALDQDGWKKAGTDVNKLQPIPQDSKLKQGMVPILRLGAFDIPQIPGVYGTPIGEVEKGVEVDIDGVVGSGLLAYFRVTLTDGGRAMWLEDVPQLPPDAPPPQKGAPSSAPPASSAPPKGEKPADKPSDKPADKPKPKPRAKSDGPASTP